jgi:hypothetical protein
VALLNSYLPLELRYLANQLTHGTASSGHPPIFGYVFMPTVFPMILGLKPIAASPTSALVGASIILAVAVLVVALAASVWHLRRGSAIAATLVTYAILGAYLAIQGADFGLFKLTLYAQPFLAAGLAVSVARAKRRYLPLVVVALVAFVAVEYSTQQGYVRDSRDPGDFRNGSAADLLPAVRSATQHERLPLVIAGANPVFIGLAAENGYGSPLFFISRDVGGPSAQVRERSHPSPTARLIQADGARPATFVLHDDAQREDEFTVNPNAERSLSNGGCTLVVPTGEQEPLNRFSLPENRHDLAILPCRSATNLLVFMDSTKGSNFYSFLSARNAVSYYQLQADPFFPGHTMAGLGRDILFQVVGASQDMRLLVNYSFSFIHDGSNAIPPSVVLGASKFALPVAGRGSARVMSAPLKPEMIDGHPYLLLDVGKTPAVQFDHRRGLDGLFGNSIPLDGRYITGYLRDVSLVSASQYGHLRPPLAVSAFPRDLGNPALEYSGVYEDGWVAQQSYFVLGAGDAADLVVHAAVPAGDAGRLTVLLDGHRIADVPATPGPLNLRIPVSRSAGPRTVALHFAQEMTLPAPDRRPVSALLGFVGFVPRTAAH